MATLFNVGEIGPISSHSSIHHYPRRLKLIFTSRVAFEAGHPVLPGLLLGDVFHTYGNTVKI